RPAYPRREAERSCAASCARSRPASTRGWVTSPRSPIPTSSPVWSKSIAAVPASAGFRYIHAMQLAPGTRLGPYEIVAPLGQGGMGEVYRARDPRLGREIAIKVLPQDLAAHPDRLSR